MRAFLALQLPSSLKEQLTEVIDLLRTGDAKVRWVTPRQMHLTLKFLGDIDEFQAGRIGQALPGAAEGLGPFKLGVGGLGAFPTRRKPRVIWVGIKENPELTELYLRLERIAVENGVAKDERDFSPHLTLGRVKYMPHGSVLVERLRSVQVETTFVEVTSLTLFESRLKPEGAQYHSLATVRW